MQISFQRRWPPVEVKKSKTLRYAIFEGSNKFLLYGKKVFNAATDKSFHVKKNFNIKKSDLPQCEIKLIDEEQKSTLILNFIVINRPINND